MVLLDAPESELALGLQTMNDVSVAGSPDNMAFRTALSPAEEQTGASPGQAGSTGVSASRPSLVELSAVTRFPVPAGEASSDRFPHELRTRHCYLLPIQKRDKGSFLQHVSVGRARNHDIVLRHHSVSKFHAWFELGDEATPGAGPEDARTSTLMVKDFDSKNRTFVDGVLIDKRTLIRPGQTVRFGSVECRVTLPASLWTALRR
jgi:hypothetical protein